MKFGGQHARRRIRTKRKQKVTRKIFQSSDVVHFRKGHCRRHNRSTTTMRFSMRLASSLIFLIFPVGTAFVPVGGKSERSSCINRDDGGSILRRLASSTGPKDDDDDSSSPSFLDGGSDLLKSVLSNKSNYLVERNKARAYSGAIPAGQDEESIRTTLTNWINEYPVFMLSLTE